MGRLTSPLYRGPVDRWDLGNTRVVDAVRRRPAAVADRGAGAGRRRARSRSRTPRPATGRCCSTATPRLVGANTYELTTLLRGQLGSEGAIGDPVPAGARVVVLDADTLGAARHEPRPARPRPDAALRAEPLRPGHPTYTEVSLAFPATGLRPFSVAQVTGRRLPSGDVAFAWVRRTRFAGDAWDPDTVPLNEEAERYDLEVTDGAGHVLRAVPGLSAPAFLYTAAMQAADFGAPRAAYTLNLYQISAVVGRGQVATRTVIP